ncbi:hypothetical protein CCS01_26995 [Rhodopila globiformis]|uniref:Schlafen AlbA-2 domain-containing protein n=2 Tax=Rhodopila globiformis TaxID=1071 RepID=A0A2S6MYY9_RHOGL|nr:hypothetical protein CCS01_26995 [Rhodopila globiformis]
MPLDRSEVDAALARISAGEAAGALQSDTLDFKEDRASACDIGTMLADAAICFANAAGGIIVLGVSDKMKGVPGFTGTRLGPGQIKRRIYERSRPPLVVEWRPGSAFPSRKRKPRLPTGSEPDPQGSLL